MVTGEIVQCIIMKQLINNKHNNRLGYYNIITMGRQNDLGWFVLVTCTCE